jgi:hypothetical protein
MKLGAALPHDNASGRDLLATECLNAAILRIAVAAVPR